MKILGFHVAVLLKTIHSIHIIIYFYRTDIDEASVISFLVSSTAQLKIQFLL